jgi:Phage integrase family
MTPKISLVAVCCSSDSFSSWNNRTFSMAITAWSAKVSSNLICAWVKEGTSTRRAVSNPTRFPLLTKGSAPKKVSQPPIAGFRNPSRLIHSGTRSPPHMLENGTDIRTIQLLLGHRSISTTANYLGLATTHVCSATSPLDLLPPKLA